MAASDAEAASRAARDRAEELEETVDAAAEAHLAEMERLADEAADEHGAAAEEEQAAALAIADAMRCSTQLRAALDATREAHDEAAWRGDEVAAQLEAARAEADVCDVTSQRQMLIT